MKFRARTNEKREIEIRWDLVNKYVSKWKPGTLLSVEIVRHQKKSSDPLRKYYFAAVLPPFMKELGYENDEELFFHQQLKVTYFKDNPDHNIHQDKRGIWRNVPSVFGNDSELPVSIKKEFTDWVIRKAAQYGVYIPDPGEQNESMANT